MKRNWLLLTIWLSMCVLFLSQACAQELAYVYGDKGFQPLQNYSIPNYGGTYTVSFSVASGPSGSRSYGENRRSIESLRREIDKKVDAGNPYIRDDALMLAMGYPGAMNINQVCSIYDRLRNSWSYIEDPRGIDYFQFANETLKIGKRANLVGAGDCDDFAILMSSFIESIGGATRIMLAYGPKGGHAYAEVYLGKMSDENGDVEKIMKWLKAEYNITESYVHINESTGDVWLNLDWSAENPGGPFFDAPVHIPILIREIYGKKPLMPPNKHPNAAFSFSPERPIAGEMITFDASLSNDSDGRIVNYEWDFGDNSVAEGKSAKHAYSLAGSHNVSLLVTDDKETRSVCEVPLAVAEAHEFTLTVQVWSVAADFKNKIVASKQFQGVSGKEVPEEVVQEASQWVAETMAQRYNWSDEDIRLVVHVPKDPGREKIKIETVPPVPFYVYCWIVSAISESGGGKSRIPLGDKKEVSVSSLANLGRDYWIEVRVPGYEPWTRHVNWTEGFDEETVLAPITVSIGIEDFEGDDNAIAGKMADRLLANPRLSITDPIALEALRKSIEDNKYQLAMNPMIQMDLQTNLGIDFIVDGRYENI